MSGNCDRFGMMASDRTAMRESGTPEYIDDFRRD